MDKTNGVSAEGKSEILAFLEVVATQIEKDFGHRDYTDQLEYARLSIMMEILSLGYSEGGD